MPEPQDWKRVVAEVLELPGLLANPSDRLTSLLTTLGTKNSGTIRAPVHCECALIAHYQNRHKSTSDVAPLGYIGVSESSCRACALFFEVSNSFASSRFYTRGSHQKWYFPWAMPECDLKISDEFVARLANHLCPALELRYAAGRMLSDSSAASGDPGEEDA